jgi:hypothetical protein
MASWSARRVVSRVPCCLAIAGHSALLTFLSGKLQPLPLSWPLVTLCAAITLRGSCVAAWSRHHVTLPPLPRICTVSSCAWASAVCPLSSSWRHHPRQQAPLLLSSHCCHAMDSLLLSSVSGHRAPIHLKHEFIF